MQAFQATVGLAVGDRFRLERRLGTSPNADTWLARDTVEGDRLCILKILGGADLAAVDQLHAFEREARVLGGLSHLGIPKVIAAISDPGGAFVLALEYIPGLDVATHLKTGPRLGEDDVFALARGLLGVLDYLHTRSPPVFHRDIKPSNIVRQPDGTPVLVDFGAVCDGWRSDHTVAVGTLGYMAPEQLHGHVSPRSDLYALGATLLHVATGRPPSECMDLQLGSLAIPRGVELNPALARLIEACIALAPGARPASAKAALALLAARPAAAVAKAAPAPVGPRGGDDIAFSPKRGLVPNAGTLPPAPRELMTAQAMVHFQRYFDKVHPPNGCFLFAHLGFFLVFAVWAGTCEHHQEQATVGALITGALWLAFTMVTRAMKALAKRPDSPTAAAFRKAPVYTARIEHIGAAGGESHDFRVALSLPPEAMLESAVILCAPDLASTWLPGHDVPVILTPDRVPVPIVASNG